MNDNMKNAIANAGHADLTTRLWACRYLVAHRDELPHKVYFCAPQGDPQWDEVRAGSTERCSCGVERMIVPANLREEFEPAEGEALVVQGQEEEGIYLRPVGGDKASCYMKIWVHEEAFMFLLDPFAPLVLSVDLFTQPMLPLENLALALENNNSKPAVMMYEKGAPVPIFGIYGADPAAGTMTIRPDKDVEVFDPEQETDGADPATHKCR